MEIQLGDSYSVIKPEKIKEVEMDPSNPFGTMVPRKMTTAELAGAIRQDIAAELDAVDVYQAHIDATDDERAKKVHAPGQ